MKEEKAKAAVKETTDAGSGAGREAKGADIVTRRGQRSLSDAMAVQADISLLRQSSQARYREFALTAARDERERRFAAAAEAWGEALKTARGENVEWCQSRMTLCLLYARSPNLPQVASEKVSRN